MSRWGILGLAILAFVQTHVHRVGFAPLIPDFVADLAIGYRAAGTLMSAYFWTYMLAQVPVGILTDRVGSRRVLLGAMTVLLVGGAGFALSGSYAQSLLARCVVGLGAAAVWLPGLRLIQEWFPPGERGRATGLLLAGGAFGDTAALLLVPVLAEGFGWRGGYALLLVPVLLTLALIFLLIRPTPLDPVRPPPGSADRGRSDGGPEPLAILARVLRTPAVWPFNVAVLLSQAAFISLLTWLPAFLVTDEGLGRPVAGLVAGLVTAGTIASLPLAGALSDRLGRRKVIFAASQGAGALVCLALAALVPGSGLAAVALTAAAAGLVLGGMAMPFVMVTELFPPASVATASGVVNTFGFIGNGLGPVALGEVLDLTGSFPAAFAGCAALQALAALAAACTRETGRARGAVTAS